MKIFTIKGLVTDLTGPLAYLMNDLGKDLIHGSVCLNIAQDMINKGDRDKAIDLLVMKLSDWIERAEAIFEMSEAEDHSPDIEAQHIRIDQQLAIYYQAIMDMLLGHNWLIKTLIENKPFDPLYRAVPEPNFIYAHEAGSIHWEYFSKNELDQAIESLRY